jgi:hypothetical protein
MSKRNLEDARKAYEVRDVELSKKAHENEAAEPL